VAVDGLVLQDDQQEDREEEQARRYGVRRQFYMQAIQAAVTFTNGAPVDANVRSWRQWGARNLGGRTRALAQDPRNPSTIYAGSAQGGVFRSDDDGDTWRPIGGAASSFPVGALAVAPSNSNVVYVGTGEPGIMHGGAALNGSEQFAAGVGFFRCDVSTRNMQNEGLSLLAAPAGTNGAANSYAAIAVDPRNADRCWIASHTGLWRRETGPTFTPEPILPAPLPVAPAFGACVTDVLLVEGFDTARPTAYRIYAAIGGMGIVRGVYDPNAVPRMNWEANLLAGGLPAPSVAPALNFDRVRIAACKSFPNHLYAVFENPADNSILSVFRTTDGGTNWQPCAVPDDLGTQAWVNLCIAVHPDNPAVVVVGNVDVARSLNAGATWEKVLDSQNFAGIDIAQHADTHALVFDVREPNRLWVGNDGGISMTPDVVNANPLVARTWRKRSHGLCISQFNDITSHPSYPFMMGGGLQDNGTYITFGGPTWVPVGDADGGQMCFEIANPRQFVAPNQGRSSRRLTNLMRSTVVPGSTVDPQRGFYPLTIRSPIPELTPPPSDVFAVQITRPVAPANVGGLFVQPVLHHPVQANNLIAAGAGNAGPPARVADVVLSTDGGANYVAGGASAAAGIGATDQVTAISFGPGNQTGSVAVGVGGPISDWWIGTNVGGVFRGTGGVPKAWAAPAGAAPNLAGSIVTSIAVHPRNANYVVVATGGSLGPPAVVQGRVFLSNNAGTNWMDITGLAAAFNLSGPPPGAAPAGQLNALPPCPITSLAFDPTVAAGSPQVLYVGTLAGVYVIRNLPRLNAAAPPAAFNPDWRSFNGGLFGPLPLTLVNDLEIVTLPARPGAAANSPESAQRLRLYAAMYGRGIFVCDVSPNYPAGVPVGGPANRLFIRQHVVEDGLAYPRATPTVLNAAPAAPTYNNPQLGGDPRLPGGVVNFNDHSAIDVRVDNAPFQFFEEVLDGVEFDEELRTKNLVSGQVNAIYVQVHNAGTFEFTQAVDVHLFFAPGAAPAAGADPAPLPDLDANFWTNFTANALPAASVWQRAGQKQTIAANRLSAAYPAVVRFEWTPPVNLAGGFAGLFAVCTNPEDPLPSPAALPVVMRDVIRRERRCAFRLVAVDPYRPDVFVRDDVEDTGVASSGSFAGRSPDIIVRQAVVADPATTFADLLDTHATDRIQAGSHQVIYVRVHNRRNVQVQAQVDVFWTKPNAATAAADPHAPVFDGTKWASVTPVGVAQVTVPPGGWAFANLTWQAADVPPKDATAGAFNAIGIVALVSSAEGVQDRAPQAARVRDAASFWQFFGRTADSNNAAFRVVLYA